MKDTSAQLSPDCFYHVYNRANGKEKLFRSKENYRFFLQRYLDFISPIADTFCYCLMPNHFHFLIRIKNAVEIKETLKESFQKYGTAEKLASKQFSKLFSSYTQSYNKVENRMGSLFMKNFKRKIITDQKYLFKLIHYIHHNPVEAGICDNPGEWEHSSYKALISNNPTYLKRNEVINWYDDLNNFIYVHKILTEMSGISG